MYPIVNTYYPITSPFDEMRSYGLHAAIDIATPVGTLLYSPNPAIVTQVSYSDRAGYFVILTHPNGYKTGYAHLSNILVEQGESIPTGYNFAQTGATGNVTGAHLHFTLRDETGQRIDPEPYYIDSFNQELTPVIQTTQPWGWLKYIPLITIPLLILKITEDDSN